MRLSPLGDSAVLIESQLPAGVASDWVRQWIRALESDPFAGVLSVAAGVTTVAVFYDPADVVRQSAERPYRSICRWIESRASVLPSSSSAAAPVPPPPAESVRGGQDRAADTAEGRETIAVESAGALTTVQDLGRARFRSRGVPLGGALDRLALRVANLLAGNPEEAAGLECVAPGPVLRFLQPTWVALGGAGVHGLPLWQPWLVQEGETLDLRAIERGARAYLALAGGVVVPPVLGSASTHLPGSVGGLEGRALRNGDVLRIGPSTTQYADTAHWSMARDILPQYQTPAVVRVLPGPQAGVLPLEGRTAFESQSFTVRPGSDRSAVRLDGAVLASEPVPDIPPEPMTAGAVFLGSDGRPGVALADGPVIGVRPKLGYVITVDLPILAQLGRGDAVRFTPFEGVDAEELLLAREHALAKLKEGLAGKRVG